MKRLSYICLMLLFALCPFVGAAQQNSEKSTHRFAVKDGCELFLDHYRAVVDDANSRRPCVMFVFGGGFVGGVRDAERYLPYFERLTADGYDVVSIDYRLGMRDVHDPNVVEAVMAFRKTVSMAVEDLYDATLYVLEHADEWNIDTTKIIASGSSAGAITVLQAENGICNGIEAAQRLPENFNYGGVVSFAGAIFSVTGKPSWERNPCPVLMFHGTADRNVPYRKGAVLGVGFFGSATIADQLYEADSPYWFYSVDYEDHSLAESPMTDNLDVIETFIERFVLEGHKAKIVDMYCNEACADRKTDFSIFDYLGSNYGD